MRTNYPLCHLQPLEVDLRAPGQPLFRVPVDVLAAQAAYDALASIWHDLEPHRSQVGLMRRCHYKVYDAVLDGRLFDAQAIVAARMIAREFHRTRPGLSQALWTYAAQAWKVRCLHFDEPSWDDLKALAQKQPIPGAAFVLDTSGSDTKD